MKIIEKIEISYFRSFWDKKTEILDLKDLNIFSGWNDSGKSNILRALNLFFNDQILPGVSLDISRDLSFQREEEIKWQEKWKTFIEITVHFQTKYKTKIRDNSFSIKKRWNSDSVHSTTVYKDSSSSREIYNIYRDVRKKFEADDKYKWQRLKSINRFLNSIFFFYVPAVKDEKFFSHLYGKILSKIQNNEMEYKEAQRTISKKIKELEWEINNQTNNIFEKLEVISSEFNIPQKLEDFFSTFDIGTQDKGNTKMKSISLKSRWDWIQAQTIPVLLDLLEKSEKSIKKPIFLRWFEEPENSYEYRNANILAEKFKNEYSKDKQVFISTHSFNFLSLSGDNVSTYRVYRKDNLSKIIWPIDNYINGQKPLFGDDKAILEEELGIHCLNKQLEEIYKTKKEEAIKLIKNRKELDQIIEQNKYILLTEGKTDAQILRIAREKLYPWKNIPFCIEPRTSADTVRIDLDWKNSDRSQSKKIVWIFDHDQEWYSKFNGLQNFSFLTDTNGAQDLFVKVWNNQKVYWLILSPPTWREVYCPDDQSEKRLEIEHYFSDEVLSNFFNNLDNFNIHKRDSSWNMIQILWVWKWSKQSFADYIEREKNNVDFSNFEIIFSKIKSIFRYR